MGGIARRRTKYGGVVTAPRGTSLFSSIGRGMTRMTRTTLVTRLLGMAKMTIDSTGTFMCW